MGLPTSGNEQIDRAKQLILDALAQLLMAKSEQRTQTDRRVAIAITDLEKVYSWLLMTREDNVE